jgi:hypothetical protein
MLLSQCGVWLSTGVATRKRSHFVNLWSSQLNSQLTTHSSLYTTEPPGQLSIVMVCAKCQKLNNTTLVTPGVKKKNEMYYGSPASSSNSTEKKPATLGQNGISKVWQRHHRQHLVWCSCN